MEWEEAANLIEEVAKSEQWIDHLLTEMMLQEMAEKNQLEVIKKSPDSILAC